MGRTTKVKKTTKKVVAVKPPTKTADMDLSSDDEQSAPAKPSSLGKAKAATKRRHDDSDEDSPVEEDDSDDDYQDRSEKKPATKRRKKTVANGDASDIRSNLPKFNIKNMPDEKVKTNAAFVKHRSAPLQQVNTDAWSKFLGKTVSSPAVGAKTLGAKINLVNDIGRGLMVDGADKKTRIPPLHYFGERSRQILHHHSEVMRWHLERTEDTAATAADEEHYQKNKAVRKEAKEDQDYDNMSDEERSAFDQAYNVPPTKTHYFKPVEVQSMYRHEKGALNLTVSANDQRSQAFLAGMKPDEVKAAYEDAAKLKPQNFDHLKETGEARERAIANAMNGQERARRSALKVLHIEEMNQTRRAVDAKYKTQHGTGRETEADMKRAEEVAALALGGKHTIILNPHGRHAEQTLKHDHKQQLEKEKKERKKSDPAVSEEHDVAGTYMRCGACSAELGNDCIHSRMKERAKEAEDEKGNKGGKNIYNGPKDDVGEVYAKQARPEGLKRVFEEVERGRTRIRSGPADRSRSLTPPPEKKQKK